MTSSTKKNHSASEECDEASDSSSVSSTDTSEELQKALDDDDYDALALALQNVMNSLAATIDKRLFDLKRTVQSDDPENTRTVVEDGRNERDEENAIIENKKLVFTMDLDAQKRPKRRLHHGKTLCSNLCFLLGACFFLFISVHNLQYAKDSKQYIVFKEAHTTTNDGDISGADQKDIAPEKQETLSMESLQPEDYKSTWVTWGSVNNNKGGSDRALQQNEFLHSYTVPSIEDLYDIIEKALTLPEATVNVNYEQRWGYPTRIFIETSSNQSMFYWTLFSIKFLEKGSVGAVTHTLLSDIHGSQAKEDFMNAKKLWYSLGAKSYQFQCSGLATGVAQNFPWTVTVNSGATTSIVDNSNSPVVNPSIPTLYDNQDLLESSIEPMRLKPSTNAPTPAPTVEQNKYLKWESYYFEELPEDIQSAAQVIGYDENSWDEDETLSTFFMSWDDLTEEQHSAADTIGFTAEEWNEYTYEKTGVSHTEPPTMAPTTLSERDAAKTTKLEEPKRDLPGISAAQGLAGMAFIVVGLCEWRIKPDQRHHWNFVIAGTLAIISALLLLYRKESDFLLSNICNCLSLHFFLAEAAMLFWMQLQMQFYRRATNTTSTSPTGITKWHKLGLFVADSMFFTGAFVQVVLSFMSIIWVGASTESINVARLGVFAHAFWIARPLIYFMVAIHMVVIAFQKNNNKQRQPRSETSTSNSSSVVQSNLHVDG